MNSENNLENYVNSHIYIYVLIRFLKRYIFAKNSRNSKNRNHALNIWQIQKIKLVLLT